MNGANDTPASPPISIGPASRPEDRKAFRTRNEEWITHFFTLEEMDRRQLGDPERQIPVPGGQVFVVYLFGEAVGCVALRPVQAGAFEVSKVAVAPALRGQSIGRQLLTYTIEQARMLGHTG